jgi:hypothetical protein
MARLRDLCAIDDRRGIPMLTRRAAVPAAAALLATALVALPASASVVNPMAGHYAQSKANVIVATFDLVGGRVRNFSHNDSCSGFGVPVPPMKVGANGAFSFGGEAIKNGIGQEYTVSVHGKAVSRTAIAGSMTYRKTKGNGPPCRTTTKFRVTRTGKARRPA